MDDKVEDDDQYDLFDNEEDILRGLEEPKYRRRRRRAGVAGGGTIVISPSTVSCPDTTPVGTAVATVSVANGFGTYVYTLSDPTGRFTIVGNQIQVASPLSAGFYNVTVNANNGQGDTPSAPLTIYVSHAAAFVPTYPYYGF